MDGYYHRMDSYQTMHAMCITWLALFDGYSSYDDSHPWVAPQEICTQTSFGKKQEMDGSAGNLRQDSN